MIIWINGTFGSGKTTVAYELYKRLPNSIVYDPERFGYVLMANIPKEILKDDFQDYPLWREANYTLLKRISEAYQGTIIVPMTLTNEQYFEEIIGTLKDDGIEIKHYTLSASKATIQKRLAKRFEGKNSWAYQQMDGRLSSLSKDIFKERIQTDGLSIDEVVEVIAVKADIELLPDNRTKIRKIIDRLLAQVKEISLFK
jgi:nicotinamide riboside kinase